MPCYGGQIKKLRMCSSKTLSPRLRTIIQVILISILYVLARMVFFQAHSLKKKQNKTKQIGHNLVPTYIIFVGFSLCASQNKLNTKDKKARTILESHYMPENDREKNTSHSKNGHFAEAISKQNGHKWSILGLSLKIPKTYRNYPLKL